MENFKREGECCCCFSKDNLYTMLEPYIFEDNIEIYSTMIAECFQIELSPDIDRRKRNLYLICNNCVLRLKDAIMLRSQVKTAYDRLQAKSREEKNLFSVYIEAAKMGENNTSDSDNHYSEEENIADISVEFSDIVETKEHVLEYKLSEYDNTKYGMNVDSTAFESNKNVLSLKPAKVVLEKFNNDTIENVSIISVGDRLKKNTKTSDVQFLRSNMFFCNICNKLFGNLENVQKHMKSHKKKPPGSDHCDAKSEECICDICERVFKRKRNLTSHMMKHMGTLNIICERSKKHCMSEDALGNQLKRCQTKKQCQVCHNFININKYVNHIKTHFHPQTEDLICNICDKVFISRLKLTRHKEMHLEAPKTCKYCNKQFQSRNSLLVHERIHSDRQSVICDYCKKEFKTKFHMVEHILKHMNIKNIKCDLCEESFVSKLSLSRHKSHHNSVSCNVCGKNMRYKKSLDSHMLTHSDDKINIYKCDICDEVFLTSRAITAHKKSVHFNQLKWRCKHCVKVFASRTSLYSHEKTHFGTKLFCDYCKKAFKSKTALRIHVLNHMGAINVKCDECNDGFATKICLWRHKEKYHNRRPLCTVCGKSYKDLKRHMLVHSEVCQFTCDKCGKSFKTKGSIHKHVTYCYFGIKYKVYYRVTPYIRPSKRNLAISRK